MKGKGVNKESARERGGGGWVDGWVGRDGWVGEWQKATHTTSKTPSHKAHPH